MNQRFDLFDLQLFLNIVNTSSLTQGAAKSAISLSAASARIKGLEQSMGSRLLERSVQGTTLTMAGRTLRDHARLVLKQVELLKMQMRDFERGLKGQIRLLAHTTAMTEILPSALAGFLAKHGEVRIELRDALSDDIVRSVEQNDADIGVVAGPVSASHLSSRPLGTHRLVVIAPAGHAITRQPAVGFLDALAWPWVCLPGTSSLQQFMERVAQQSGRSISPRVQVGNFDGMCLMVAAGVGIGIVPESAFERYGSSLPLHATVLEEPWALREMRLITRNDSELPPLVHQLVGHLDTFARERQGAPR